MWTTPRRNMWIIQLLLISYASATLRSLYASEQDLGSALSWLTRFGEVTNLLDRFKTSRIFNATRNLKDAMDEIAAKYRDEAKFIRTFHKNGCLESTPFAQVLFSESCVPQKAVTWSFEEPLLAAHDAFGMSLCLTCEDAKENCRLITRPCLEHEGQKWSIGFPANRTTDRGEALFSIHNVKFPHQCATINLEKTASLSQHGIELKNCTDPADERQLFFVGKDWFSIARKMQNILSVQLSHLLPAE